MSPLFRRIRRRWITRKPFPQEWLAILNERVPCFARLSGSLREQFLADVQIFAHEKRFTSAGGMEITDEVRVVISACAIRLVMHLNVSYYDRLSEIIVYPYVYRHPEETSAILGEADDWGTVVLSWPTVLEDLSRPGDGNDTAAHEFAHVLDRMADGVFDGTPRLRTSSDYRSWALIMSRHFLGLRNGDKKVRTVLRMYGATNEAEFFAVATEAYFENSRLMKELLPELYAELQGFYGGDPAAEDELDRGAYRR
jgi:MtfA peptidase